MAPLFIRVRIIETPKQRIGQNDPVKLFVGMNAEINFQSTAGPERFRLIIERHRFNPQHAKYQFMTASSDGLLRLEIDGPTHWNPDDEEIPCPHIHRYREGAGLRWAMPITDQFGDPSDLVAGLTWFMGYCNIVQVPTILSVRSLF
jgi:hypothetical protein